MKKMTLEEFVRSSAGSLDAAQREKILILRAGKPAAVLIGVEHLDREDWEWASSPEFWKTIRHRRDQESVPLKEAEKSLSKKNNKGE